MYRNKYFRAGLLIIPLFLFLFSCAPQKQGLVICMGDSLTAGYKVNKNNAYPAQLEKLVSIKVLNKGSTGETTGAAVRRITEVLAFNPSHVILEYGANDFFLGTPAADFETNMRIIIESCLKQHVKTALVSVFDNTMTAMVSGNNRNLMQEYSAVIEKLALDSGLVLITDIWQGRFFDTSLKADEFHPNRTGHTVIAEHIYKKLKETDFF